ncbi:MAG TPA: Rap1a/Tai family immunity protein [Stellaceae bacterium]|jgi:hypothetical protein|nr:Rap1a/Tai family immunity protein [Stellaceae bacterium]
MKKIIMLCLLSPFGIAMWPHDAAALTGKELYQSCSTQKASSELTCIAYVHGFIDGMIMGYTAHGTSRGYCPPVTGISVARGRSIIEKWLRGHPERLKTEASILSGLALAEAYPCKPGSN